MPTTNMAKQMIDFQKTIFNNSFNTLSVFQNQTESMIKSFTGQLPWMTEDGKKQISENFNLAKKAGDEFKKAVDDGYAKFEALLN